MLIDFNVENRQVLVIGGGHEAEFKTLKLLDGKAKVTVAAKSFTPGLTRLAATKSLSDKRGNERGRAHPKGAPRLISTAALSRSFILDTLGKVRPKMVFVATGDPELDELAAKECSASGAIVCVVDTPALNDFNMPAVSKVGDFRIAVSTQGLSPAMASVIRKRVERLITREDVLQVKLQGYLRRVWRKRLKDAESRKRFAYEIINDTAIQDLLRRGRYDEARESALKKLALRSEPRG